MWPLSVIVTENIINHSTVAFSFKTAIGSVQDSLSNPPSVANLLPSILYLKITFTTLTLLCARFSWRVGDFPSWHI